MIVGSPIFANTSVIVRGHYFGADSICSKIKIDISQGKNQKSVDMNDAMFTTAQMKFHQTLMVALVVLMPLQSGAYKRKAS